MESILIIETPAECIECPFHRIYADGHLTDTFCILTARRNANGVNTRAKWCPLKPLPHSKQMENRWFSDDYSKGWNDCLKEITE